MIKRSLFILSIGTMLIADTTMCFKKDWMDPSTIESTVLDGGKCLGSKSLVDMKQDGWLVDDIKISSGNTGMNFMYILKKGDLVMTTDQMEEKLVAIQEKREKKKNEETIVDSVALGKTKYIDMCQRCHKDGKVQAYGTARPLVSLDLEELKHQMNMYSLDQKKGGLVILMKPYADLLSQGDIENVYNYLQTIK